jgi:hypothetical protein
MDDESKHIAELQDGIKHRDRCIEELRREIDEGRDIICCMEENVEDCCNVLERWKETFDMVETEGTWGPFWNEYSELIKN